MELRHLRALVSVADSGSVTRAAQLLHLVQPAVTRQIRSLEAELGVPLFDRTRDGMRPTAEGVALVARARRALDELERARAEIRPNQEQVAGIAAVGLLGSVEAMLAGPLLEAVTDAHPGVELQLVSAYSGHLQTWLVDGDVDLSLLYNLTDNESLRVVPLLRDELWAVAPPDADLQVDRPIELASVMQHPFVLPVAGQHGIRVLLDQALARRGLKARTVARVNTMELQKLLVASGAGWTVLPAPGVVEQVRRGELSAAPLSDTDMTRTIVLGLRRGGPTSAAAQVVATELIDVVRTCVRAGRWPSAHLLEPGKVAGPSQTVVTTSGGAARGGRE